MDFDCPLAFRHKKGEYILSLQSFCFQRESIFVGQSLWSLDCIQVLHIVFYLLPYFCWDIHVRGSYFYCFIYFLFSTVYGFIFMSFFIDICIYCVLFEIKNLLYLLVFFPHMRLCILFSVSRNIQVDSIELLSTLATDKQQLGLNLFYEHYLCKGILFVNFEFLVVFCHGLPKGEFVRF